MDAQTCITIIPVADVAKAWRCSPEHINRLIKRGELQAVLLKKPGRPGMRMVPMWAAMAYQNAAAAKLVAEALGIAHLQAEHLQVGRQSASVTKSTGT